MNDKTPDFLIKDFMLDLETFGLEDDCVVLQFGLVVFEQKRRIPVESCSIFPNVCEQIINGFSMDSDALEFWKKQPQKAIDECIINPKRVNSGVVTDQLRSFLDRWWTKESIIWANGMLFDINVSEHYLNTFNDDFSFKSVFGYNKFLDFRSIRDLRKKQLTKNEYDSKMKQLRLDMEKNKNSTRHEAISDCLWQIETMRLLDL